MLNESFSLLFSFKTLYSRFSLTLILWLTQAAYEAVFQKLFQVFTAKPTRQKVRVIFIQMRKLETVQR